MSPFKHFSFLQSKKKSELILLEILRSRNPRVILDSMDKLSNTICLCTDYAEAARNLKPSLIAQNVHLMAMNFIQSLNLNKKLFQKLEFAINSNDLDPIRLLLAKSFLKDFYQSGIHLSNEKQQNLTFLQTQINTLSRDFYINNKNLEQTLFLLRKCRMEYAQMLGFDSFASFFLQDKMLNTQNQVFDFLNQISETKQEKFEPKQMQFLDALNVFFEVSKQLFDVDFVFEKSKIEILKGTVLGTIHLFKSEFCAHYVLKSRCIHDKILQLPEVIVATNGDAMSLWHELGHAMHTILSFTDFQHLSGTRCTFDLGEFPSQFFELICSKYAWDEVPTQYKALDIFNAVYDQLLYSSLLPSKQIVEQVHLNPENMGLSNYPILCQLLKQKKPIKNPHIHLKHLAFYSAGYYSYLWCFFLSQKIYNRHFLNKSEWRNSGLLLRNELLGWGGLRDPFVCLQKLN